MPSSSRASRLNQLHEQVGALCWGAWSELGVSGWGRTHQDWAIDPEPLVVFTVTICNDPRLRDEVTDWCVHNWRHLSRTRLRHIVERQREDALADWGVFAATVNERSGARLPGATQQRAAFRLTGKSILRPLPEPSQVVLRMRAMFGVSARAEILRHLLLHPDQRVTAAVLADTTNYAKRNVADACDLLVAAGVLSSRSVRNRFYFSLTNRNALQRFVGQLPDVAPDWNALLRVVSVVLRSAEEAQQLPNEVLAVVVHQALGEMADDLDLLGLDGPRRLRGAAILDQWNRWTADLVQDLASGSWPGEEIP